MQKKTKRQKQVSDNNKYGIKMTKKHLLVHDILVRWHYCLPEWPPKPDNIFEEEGYLETGFKGVFAGYRGNACGDIRDLRSSTLLMPSLSNLINVPSEKLKELLLSGLEKQKQDLIKHKHLNSEKNFNQVKTSIEKEIIRIGKLNPGTIERDYGKKIYVE